MPLPAPRSARSASGSAANAAPLGAARMLGCILARDPALVIAEVGLAEGTRKRRGGEAGRGECNSSKRGNPVLRFPLGTTRRSPASLGRARSRRRSYQTSKRRFASHDLEPCSVFSLSAAPSPPVIGSGAWQAIAADDFDKSTVTYALLGLAIILAVTAYIVHNRRAAWPAELSVKSIGLRPRGATSAPTMTG